MNVTQLKKFCLGFPGASERLYPPPENFLAYAVGGKTFAYFKTSDPERWRFSTRVSPDRFIELTDIPGVKPITGSELLKTGCPTGHISVTLTP